MQIPWRAAPRAALSSPLTLLVSVVTALLLSFVVAAAVLHSSASGSAAIAYQEDRLCDQLLHPGLDAKKGVPTKSVNEVVDIATKAAGGGEVLAGTYTEVRRADFGGAATFAKFGYREGAVDRLRVLEGGSRDGLWVPLSLTKTVEGFQLGQRGMGGRLPPVTAVYADLNDPLDQWWCTERQFVIPNIIDKNTDVTSAVVWMPSRQSFLDLPESVTAGGVGMTVRFPTEAPATAAEAQALLERGTAVLDRANLGLRRNVVLPLPVENARATIGNVRSAILPLTLISLLIGLAGVATVTSGWVQRCHTELRMLWCRGSGPAALGGRAVLELGLPLLLGGIAGLGVAWLLLPVYAPSTSLEPGTVPTAAAAVGVVVLASLVVTWLVAAFRTHRAFQGRPSSGRARRVFAAVPWELATGVLAVLAWQRLRESGLSTPVKIGGLPRIDAAALAFPLLVVLTTALLAARVLRVLLRLSHRMSLWHLPAAQIAVRRLAATAGPVTGVLLVGVLAIGTIAVGSTVAGAQKASLDDKSGFYTGANSVVQIGTDLVTGARELPAELRGSTTIVGVSSQYERTALVVDPATFTDGAYLGAVDPDELRARLTEPLRIGTTPNRAVQLPGLPPLNPTAGLPSFPKVGTSGYVVPIDRITSVKDVNTWYLWSSRSAIDLVRPLQAAEIGYRNVEERSKAISGLPFLTIQWTFTFVTAIGGVLAIVAAIALLLAIEVRRRQNAVAGALSTRMGMSPATLLSSHLVELGALTGFAVVVGSAAGAIGTGFAVPRLDPAPRLAPGPVLPNLLPLLTTTVLGSALVVVAAAWIALRASRSARIGELIRG
ncbi:FtsX-like permease family protein [Umezawaea endophytica]|uniref:ABC transporter permease n=1 Tax=Umezawaea endophytica TaxID=1654476 RepID=A0A9X2VUU1_9PSEU|nr:FtsX-like permease family protein [Umezawaea endophytica]MCS7482033.1 ABC transporter permease [Umezawaea endophytica]